FDFDTPYNVYGGLQDNGSWRGPSSIHQRGGIRGYFWKDVGFGDGFDVQPDPTDSRMGYSMAQGGNLVRWNLTTGERKRIAPAPEGDTKLRFNWNAGLAIDPFDPATIYYGSQFVHRSKNRGDSWEVLSPDLTTNNPEWQKQNESGGLTPDVSTAENYTTIMTIAPSAVERGVIWVGTDDGRVQVTRDGGKTWASVEKNLKGVPANTWVPHIEASKFQGGEAFVVLDNHRRSDWASYVYRTTDYGATWKSLATPDVKGYCLVLEQDPVKPELLFLGTEFGLFLSFDGGAKWYPFRQGLGTASVMDLAVHPRDNDLIIATHGRAMYIVDDIRPLREMSDATVGQKLQLFSVAPAAQFHFSSEDGGFGGGMADYRGENRDYGALVSYWLGDDDLPLPDGKKEAERQKALRAKKAAEAAAPPAPEKATGPKAAGAKPAAAPAAEGDKGEEKGKGEGKPEVTLEISDAGGKLVRTLKVPATRGLNRTVWALDRDAFKQPPREEGRRRRRGNDGGPELAPGTYQLVAKFRGEEAKTTITVLPDSTSKAVAADWQAHEQAVQRLGATNDRLVDAIQRIRTTRADIDLVSQKLREKLTDAGEKDDKKIDEHPLIKAAGPLQEGLTKLEKKLWQPPEAKGLLPGDDAFSKLGEAFFGIDASWGAPTANDLTLLAAAEKLANSALEEGNAYFAKDVADYKAKVAAEGVGLLTK
nr:hypothetical protein [Thermoanaerobaculia bacterium]